MSEYGHHEQFPIITEQSRFRVTGADIERWRTYAWGAIEWGPVDFGPPIRRDRAAAPAIDIAALVRAFEAKRDADIASWMKG